jgi:uncharacterized coiled-coil DUF342 family protein
MPKVTVADIYETRRNLKRLENYANRNMRNLPINEINEQVKQARELLSNTVDDFDNTDVSTLTRDITDIEKEIELREQSVENYKELVREYEELATKNESKGITDEWTLEYLQDYKNILQEGEERLAELNEMLK